MDEKEKLFIFHRLSRLAFNVIHPFRYNLIMYVKLFKGQSWRLALISNMSASGMCKVTKVLPKVFFRACLVRPTSLSQKLSYQGALLGMISTLDHDIF